EPRTAQDVRSVTAIICCRRARRIRECTDKALRPTSHFGSVDTVPMHCDRHRNTECSANALRWTSIQRMQCQCTATDIKSVNAVPTHCDGHRFSECSANALRHTSKQ